jgi:predicted small lipoprotein YifL
VSAKKSVLTYAFALLLLAALAGCQREGPAQRAGKQADRAAAKAGDRIDEAADKLRK